MSQLSERSPLLINLSDDEYVNFDSASRFATASSRAACVISQPMLMHPLMTSSANQSTPPDSDADSIQSVDVDEDEFVFVQPVGQFQAAEVRQLIHGCVACMH